MIIVISGRYEPNGTKPCVKLLYNYIQDLYVNAAQGMWIRQYIVKWGIQYCIVLYGDMVKRKP